MACDGQTIQDAFTDANSVEAVGTALNAKPCTKLASGETSLAGSANVSPFTGLSVDKEFTLKGQVGSSGCSAMDIVATTYKIAHDQITCLINSVRQSTTNTTNQTQSIVVECTNCTGSVTINQDIDSNIFVQNQFTANVLAEIKQITDDSVAQYMKVVNENTEEFGAMSTSDARAGQTTDVIIQTTQQQLTDNNTVQEISNNFLFSQDCTMRFINWEGPIVINQTISTQIAASNYASSALTLFLSQFSEASVQTVFDIQNSNESKGISSLFSGIIGILAIVVVVALGGGAIYLATKGGGPGGGGPGGETSGGGMSKGKKLAIGVMVAGVVLLVLGIVVAVLGSLLWGIIISIVSVLLLGVGGYLLYKLKMANQL
jgi:hypothetical protein